MQFQGYRRLEFDYRGRVLWITIRGQGRMNSVDREMHEDLSRVFTDVQQDPESDVVVLTAAGSAFCAGGDMKWFQQTIAEPSQFRDLLPEAKRIINSMLDLEKPIICRMNGTAAGLGASLALLCDLVVADEAAMIGDPHVKAGLVAADGGAILWPQMIGFARAKEALLTGELVTARRAAEMGLINYAVPAADLDMKVDELVKKLLANPRWAVRWTKASINVVLRDLANRVSDVAFSYEVLTNLTADRREAVTSFLEKRAPRYSGE
jgi:enoyl-CoA hydratase